MSKYPLSIAGIGMISCLGEGAEINAAAMRCDFDGFQETDFNQPFYAEKQLGAPVETKLRGIDKLCYMSKVVVEEALKNLPENYSGLNVIFCMPSKVHMSFFNNDDALQEIIKNSFTSALIDISSLRFTTFWQHRCGFVNALKKAQHMLYQNRYEFVLIVSLDSLLNNKTLSMYGGELYGVNRRLLGNNHSNGFIPGEAAIALLLSTPRRYASDVIISGVGIGNESATLEKEDEILKGNGLTDAIFQASRDAGVEIHDTAFRVSSVSGEDYFFKEAALVQIKTLKEKISEQPLWHPADHIGEVGAAIGGAIVVMTYYAFVNDYAPGNTAVCQMSNDDSQRSAFIIQRNIN